MHTTYMCVYNIQEIKKLVSQWGFVIVNKKKNTQVDRYINSSEQYHRF